MSGGPWAEPPREEPHTEPDAEGRADSADATGEERADETGAPAEALFFTSLDEFVRTYLCPVICRRTDHATQTWCARWWMHPEAVVRLSAMWSAFEYLRVDPVLGMSTWWTQHADPHLAMLMHPELGPFAACDPRTGHTDYPFDPLPAEPAPDWLMANDAFALQPGGASADPPEPPSRAPLRERLGGRSFDGSALGQGF